MGVDRLSPEGLSVRTLGILASCALAVSCGGGASPAAPSAPPLAATTVVGSVAGRLTDEPIDGSRITFAGVTTHSAAVSGGRFQIEIPPGQYRVSIDGPTHVPHQTQIVNVSAGADLRFTVLRWGTQLFGATYDETFHKVFHQMARVGGGGITGIRKWVVPPSEIYIAEGTVPSAQIVILREVIADLWHPALVPLWCGFAGDASIVTGPEPEARDGRIVVRPNWDGPITGSLEQGAKRRGIIQVNVYAPAHGRLRTREELAGSLLHEFFHVAFAFHVCGGDRGENPFGFAPDNCPVPDSIMANRGVLMHAPSPQDRLAACLVYDEDTQVRNHFPDINARYAGQ